MDTGFSHLDLFQKGLFILLRNGEFFDLVYLRRINRFRREKNAINVLHILLTVEAFKTYSISSVTTDPVILGIFPTPQARVFIFLVIIVDLLKFFKENRR